MCRLQQKVANRFREVCSFVDFIFEGISNLKTKIGDAEDKRSGDVELFLESVLESAADEIIQ